ncbi:MAG: peptide-methionine (S)-S-oxide reductase MsrA, partial [Methylobacteriaceae bacterium]|nr:peptide-methionine (S)-S-oxide reductase MsrA [Methylobacteriaceae bacterium]
MTASTKKSHASKVARGALVAGLLLGGATLAEAAESAVALPPPAQTAPESSGLQKVVLAGGCFWGVQGVFQHMKGVTSAVSGYAGGSPDQANYSAVSAGRTGHAESVEVTFDPHVVSYGQILQVFFSVAHDPTELDRQGPDVGSQYRSEVFAANETQANFTKDYVAQLDKAGAFRRKIVTKIEPLKTFSAAEAYHQDYLVQHPHQPYIVFNDLPKIENLKRLYPDLYRATPKLVADG